MILNAAGTETSDAIGESKMKANGGDTWRVIGLPVMQTFPELTWTHLN